MNNRTIIHQPVATKMTIGWREWLFLPDLKIPAIKAKIDTGARTSALHTFSLEPFIVAGQLKVRFGIHPLQKKRKPEIFCTADVIDQRRVSDSGGHIELRYFIRTTANLGSIDWPIEMSLTNRDNMRFRMLLGRSALKGIFLVDPIKSYATGRKLAKYYTSAKLNKMENL
jgi:hypothetical protein